MAEKKKRVLTPEEQTKAILVEFADGPRTAGSSGATPTTAKKSGGAGRLPRARRRRGHRGPYRATSEADVEETGHVYEVVDRREDATTIRVRSSTWARKRESRCPPGGPNPVCTPQAASAAGGNRPCRGEFLRQPTSLLQSVKGRPHKEPHDARSRRESSTNFVAHPMVAHRIGGGCRSSIRLRPARPGRVSRDRECLGGSGDVIGGRDEAAPTETFALAVPVRTTAGTLRTARARWQATATAESRALFASPTAVRASTAGRTTLEVRLCINDHPAAGRFDEGHRLERLTIALRTPHGIGTSPRCPAERPHARPSRSPRGSPPSTAPLPTATPP